MVRDIRERFWARVQVGAPNECWEWTPPYTAHGYGQMFLDGHMWKAHRLSWMIHYGAIPPDLCVCHHCDNRKCVNAAHLFLGTLQDNLHDMRKKHRDRAKPKGSWSGTKNIRARLNDDLVRAIRHEYSGRHGDLSKLARKYDIAITAIDSVVKRRTWKHVE